MTLKPTLILALATIAFAPAALSQQPAKMEGTVVASEPGSATAVRTVNLSAQVVAIDKATRTVTLKGVEGIPVDVVAGDGVRNFDQIKLGDLVVVRYAEALALDLRESKAAGGGVLVTEGGTRAKPGAPPVAAGERRITAIADVVAVDPQQSTITLKGPRGNVATLAVHNPDQFKVVKAGDQIDVTYIEALALSVEPAPQAGREGVGSSKP
jgi:hypothetical protein